VGMRPFKKDEEMVWQLAKAIHQWCQETNEEDWEVCPLYKAFVAEWEDECEEEREKADIKCWWCNSRGCDTKDAKGNPIHADCADPADLLPGEVIYPTVSSPSPVISHLWAF